MVSLVTTVYELHKSYSISSSGNSFKFSSEWKKNMSYLLFMQPPCMTCPQKKGQDVKKKKKS